MAELLNTDNGICSTFTKMMGLKKKDDKKNVEKEEEEEEIHIDVIYKPTSNYSSENLLDLSDDDLHK